MRYRLSNLFAQLSALLLCANCVLATSAADQKPTAPANRDYSKEAFVVEKSDTRVSFAADGTSERNLQTRIRVQSEAGVRAFGVLNAIYTSDSERLDIVYVRVHKPDGRVVETPRESIQDISPEVTRSAPTYSDVREKQIPVKALGSGDLLEYEFHWKTTKAQVPGQFWFAYTFTQNVVELSETLEIRVPASKYVKVASPHLSPETREEDGQKIYFWKHAQLETAEARKPRTAMETKTSPATDKVKAAAEASMTVQLTTFHDWQEVGRWYARLVSDRLTLTPAIKAKAEELTKELHSDAEKERAIYNYVSTRFRYISLSFGIGRLQPHTADEVLNNQYGDCKDKHTLFAALLKAVNIEAWPALIGAGIKLDPEVPSPAQFNHLITVIPQGTQYLWLDTTPEVAPFGLLFESLRDQQALVIPGNGKQAPELIETAAGPPFPKADLFEVKGNLSSDGTLSAHFSISLRGDVELALRAGFHQTAPAQWQTGLQELVHMWGFAGDVSNVEVDNPETLDRPFHFAYDYSSKNYSDWANRRIGAPFVTFSFGPAEDAEKPEEPPSIGETGESVYRASIELPEGYSIQLPENVKLQKPFAEYAASYSFSKGTLAIERRLVVKQSKLPLSSWGDYVQMAKLVRTDESQWMQLSQSTDTAAAPAAPSNPQAAELVNQAIQAMQSGNVNAARDALNEAERLNPKERGLWGVRGGIDQYTGDPSKAIDEYKKELEYHPENTNIYAVLAHLQVASGDRDAAIQTVRTLVDRQPDDIRAIRLLASILAAAKRYADALPAIDRALKTLPDNSELLALRAEFLLRCGRKEEGVQAARAIPKATADPVVLNDIAYALADTSSGVSLAAEFAEASMRQSEDKLKDVRLADLSQEELNEVTKLAAIWDTLGWIYFRQGDLQRAEKYVAAAWKLGQHAAMAEHLGEIYDKQGMHEAAIHMWRLALGANSNFEEAKEQLRKAGASLQSQQKVQAGKRTIITLENPGEELGKLRTVGIPALPKQTGSAEFFVLFTAAGPQDAQYISGDEKLKDAARQLCEMKFDMPFPDEGPEKIVRRGILSCSELTHPSCQFVLLLPANTRK